MELLSLASNMKIVLPFSRQTNWTLTFEPLVIVVVTSFGAGHL